MENNINLTPDAVKAIQALQHPCGTYQFYRTHLDRLFNYILNNSDEIGMSDNEAMYALRALNALRSDIADIAGSPAPLNEPVDPFDSITLTAAPEQLDSDENGGPNAGGGGDRLQKKRGNRSKLHVTRVSGYSTFQRKRRVSKNSATFPNTSKCAMVKIGEIQEQEATSANSKQQIPPNKIQPQGKRLI